MTYRSFIHVYIKHYIDYKVCPTQRTEPNKVELQSDYSSQKKDKIPIARSIILTISMPLSSSGSNHSLTDEGQKKDWYDVEI